VHAIKQMMQDGIKAEDVTEELVSSYLYTSGLPDPELIIRTSGELRVSNFLIWQGSYSELYATPVYWPAFNKEEYRAALVDFSQRRRRFGLTDAQLDDLRDDEDADDLDDEN
jgi:undecaprenyl diphosphate synthase